MKIVLISTGVYPVYPRGYSGLEAVVGDLAMALCGRGHDVTVVCPDESTIDEISPVKTIKCGPCTPDARGWEANAFGKYAGILLSPEYQGAVIHDHTWAKGIYMLKRDHPQLHAMSTLHGMLPYQTPPPVAKPSMAGISKHHADSISAGLGIPTRYAYNGINLDKYPFSQSINRNGRFLFLARMTAFKGAHVFIDLMRSISSCGDLVGDDVNVESQEYVERLKQSCEAYPDVKYHGGVDRERAARFFQESSAYILPCTQGWQEPFGLSVVEAMACGCPVLATRSGAIPELIIEGKTGFVVNTTQDLQDILKSGKLWDIKSEDCRKRAEDFSREKMAESYLTLYEEVLNGGW